MGSSSDPNPAPSKNEPEKSRVWALRGNPDNWVLFWRKGGLCEGDREVERELEGGHSRMDREIEDAIVAWLLALSVETEC